MAQEIWRWKVLGHHIGLIVFCRYMLDFDHARGVQLADLEETAVDVARPIARFAVTR